MKRERGVDEDAAPLDIVVGESVVDLVALAFLLGVSLANGYPGKEDFLLAQLFPSVSQEWDRSVPRCRLPPVEGAGTRELEGKVVRTLLRRQAGPVVVNPRR